MSIRLKLIFCIKTLFLFWCEYYWFGQLGGPVVAIPTGRRDGTVSAAENVRPNIIDTDFTVDKMINIFSSKGLSVQDLVVLSGIYMFLGVQKQEILSI